MVIRRSPSIRVAGLRWRPVSDRKTSSRLGRWIDTLAAGAPAPPSRQSVAWTSARRPVGDDFERAEAIVGAGAAEAAESTLVARRVGELEPEDLGPDARLQLLGAALGDDPPWSSRATVSASWSASSRYWVVSRMVTPVLDQVADGVPQLLPAARVESGASARRGTAARAARSC